MNKGKSFLEVLKPLSLTDTIYNEEFITNSFLKCFIHQYIKNEIILCETKETN